MKENEKWLTKPDLDKIKLQEPRESLKSGPYGIWGLYSSRHLFIEVFELCDISQWKTLKGFDLAYPIIKHLIDTVRREIVVHVNLL